MRDRIKALLAQAQDNPNDDIVLAELALLLRAERDWAVLSLVLAQRAVLATTEADRAARWLEHAQVCELELCDVHQAVESYSRAAEVDPAARAALARLRDQL